MILLRKVSLKRIEWDPSILDHLSFALSVSGDLSSLANNLEELLPGIIRRSERFHTLALCYYGAGKDLVALDLLRKLLNGREMPKHVHGLLMASKICCENPTLAEEGVSFSQRAAESLDGRCKQLEHVAKFYLGVSLSAHSKLAVSDVEKFKRQSEALQALETAGRMTGMRDPLVLYHLSLEYAEQRKLDDALYYAKCVIKLEGGSNVKGWLLLARILSAQKKFLEAESIINAALDQTGKWDQGDLLRTKAKIQIAQGQLKNAIETYSQLLAVLQIQRKSFGSWKKLYKVCCCNHFYQLKYYFLSLHVYFLFFYSSCSVLTLSFDTICDRTTEILLGTWKWKYGMILLMCTSVFPSGMMQRCVFQNLKPSNHTPLLDVMH
jgi:tetratricopeptide (TPR) repeat protein